MQAVETPQVGGRPAHGELRAPGGSPGTGPVWPGLSGSSTPIPPRRRWRDCPLFGKWVSQPGEPGCCLYPQRGSRALARIRKPALLASMWSDRRSLRWSARCWVSGGDGLEGVPAGVSRASSPRATTSRSHQPPPQARVEPATTNEGRFTGKSPAQNHNSALTLTTSMPGAPENLSGPRAPKPLSAERCCVSTIPSPVPGCLAGTPRPEPVAAAQRVLRLGRRATRFYVRPKTSTAQVPDAGAQRGRLSRWPDRVASLAPLGGSKVHVRVKFLDG